MEQQTAGTTGSSGGTLTVDLPGERTTTSGATFTTPSLPPHPVNTYQARMFAIRELRDYTQHLAGDILTIVDASVIDPRQNRALKTLIKRALWNDHYEKALWWVEQQIRIEQAGGVVPQEWPQIDLVLAQVKTDVYNVFPFSVSPNPGAAAEHES